jgi:hypothetical protein
VNWEDCGLRPGRAKSPQNPISTVKTWAWWCIALIPATAGSINRRIAVHASLGKKQDSISKITIAKRAGGVVQVVQHLPRKSKL